MDLTYLEGKKFCVVFVKADDDEGNSDKLELKCLHGRASIDRAGRLHVEHGEGRFTVPSSSYPSIQESDATEILKDSQYFVMCKVSGMEL